MKRCSLDKCEFNHEGFCIAVEFLFKTRCKAKTNADLVCSECGKKECVCND